MERDSSDDDASGILTPAERRVLDYVRAGVIDAETAVRLGVSVGEVKARIESMCTKLRLPDRAALAAWRPDGSSSELAPASSPSPDDGEAAVTSDESAPSLAPETYFPTRTLSATGTDQSSSRLNVGAFVSLAVVVLIAAGVLVFLLSQGGGDAPPASTVRPQPARTVMPTPTPVLYGGIEVTTITNFTFAPPPEDLALIYLAHNVDGGQRLVRITRKGGDFVTEELFEAKANGLISAVALPDGSEIWVTVCRVGNCFGGDPGEEPVASELLRSVDGGATWESMGEHQGYYVAARAEPGYVFLAHVETQTQGAMPSFVRFDAARRTFEDLADWRDFGLGSSGWYWREYSLPWLSGNAVLAQAVESDDQKRALLSWFDIPSERFYFGELQDGQLVSAYQLADGLQFLPVRWLDGDVAGGFADMEGNALATFDPATGEFVLHRLQHADGKPLSIGLGARLLAIQRGFARVVSSYQPECLPVHVASSIRSGVADCLAIGTVVHHTYGVIGEDGEHWLHIVHTDGLSGWVPADHLQLETGEPQYREVVPAPAR